jgi:hypothetical protein
MQNGTGNALKTLTFHSDEGDIQTYIRLCHHCLCLNESEEVPVDYCKHCKKALSTDAMLEEMDAEELMDLSMEHEEDIDGEGAGTSNHSFETISISSNDFVDIYPPLTGLEVNWE